MRWQESDLAAHKIRNAKPKQREIIIQSERAQLENVLETEIESQICDFLRFTGIPFTRTKAENGSVIEGWPDLTGCYQARMLAIEVKTASGKLRSKQAVILSQLWEAGALLVIARCVEDVRDAVRSNHTPQATVNEIVAKLNQRGK
jgi:hypothetical protein